MNVLITGAHGLVGRHLADRLGQSHEVLPFGRVDLDITDADQVFASVKKERPQLVLNCAVIGVDECESDPEKAAAVNVTGPENLAKAASDVGARIVHFSTNYVFDGERKTGSYTIDDEPRPINLYGRTKLQGERAVQAACERAFIVRTSWVYGGGTKGFFDRSVQALRRGEPVSAVVDNWASTTYIGDLVERVIEIIERGRCGIYHVANDGVCSKYEFAAEAARAMCGSDELLRRIHQADAKLIARRPVYTPIRCLLSQTIGLDAMRDWRLSLRSFVS